MVNKDQKSMFLRLPADLATVIEQRANQRLRSLNSQVIVLLKTGLVNEIEESHALSSADELIAKIIKGGKKSFFSK